jgi:hypothetical protein
VNALGEQGAVGSIAACEVRQAKTRDFSRSNWELAQKLA